MYRNCMCVRFTLMYFCLQWSQHTLSHLRTSLILWTKHSYRMISECSCLGVFWSEQIGMASLQLIMANKLKISRTMLPDNPSLNLHPNHSFHTFSLRTCSDTSFCTLQGFSVWGQYCSNGQRQDNRNCCSPTCLHYRLHSHCTCKSLQLGEQHTCKIELVWPHHHQERGVSL